MIRALWTSFAGLSIWAAAEATREGGSGSGAVIVTFLAIVVAAAAGAYQRFSLAGIKAEAFRLDRAVEWYRDENRKLEERASKAERQADVWRTRYEIAKGMKSSDSLPSTPSSGDA